MTHAVYGFLSIFIGVAVAAQIFVGCWIACTVTFSPTTGFCLGWLPSILFAYASYFIAASFWPFFAAVLVLGMLFLVAVVLAPAPVKHPAASRAALDPPTLWKQDNVSFNVRQERVDVARDELTK